MSKGSFHCTTGMIVYVWRFCGLGRANRYSTEFGLRYNYQISGGSMWCTQCGLRFGAPKASLRISFTFNFLLVKMYQPMYLPM